jgi:hypothetical protein
MATTIKVNGADRTVDVDGDTPLWWVLRDLLFQFLGVAIEWISYRSLRNLSIDPRYSANPLGEIFVGRFHASFPGPLDSLKSEIA